MYLCGSFSHKHMKFRRPTISALCSLALAAAGITADAAVKDLPVKEINGRSYHYYTVENKETIYSLCHKFGISKRRACEV